MDPERSGPVAPFQLSGSRFDPVAESDFPSEASLTEVTPRSSSSTPASQGLAVSPQRLKDPFLTRGVMVGLVVCAFSVGVGVGSIATMRGAGAIVAPEAPIANLFRSATGAIGVDGFYTAAPRSGVEPTTAGERAVMSEPVPQSMPVREPAVSPQQIGHDPVEVAATETTPVVAVSNLAGEWTLETHVESSSLRTFEGLRLGYRLELRQDGDRIVGTGRKVSENGVSLRGRRQTSIAVRGTMDGGRLTLIFGEQGARRHTTGTFELVLEDAGLLRGSFASDAARSAGVVEARRL